MSCVGMIWRLVEKFSHCAHPKIIPRRELFYLFNQITLRTDVGNLNIWSIWLYRIKLSYWKVYSGTLNLKTIIRSNTHIFSIIDQSKCLVYTLAVFCYLFSVIISSTSMHEIQGSTITNTRLTVDPPHSPQTHQVTLFRKKITINFPFSLPSEMFGLRICRKNF